MIIKDNLLRLQGMPQRRLRGVAGYPHLRSFGRFGAEPWEYQPDDGIPWANAPSAEEHTQPVLEPQPTNYVMKESGNAYYDDPGTTSSQPSQVFNWTGIIDILGGVVKGFSQPRQQQPIVVQQQQKSMIPSWVLPVAITGGAGLLAVAVLNKPRRARLSGYRRRSRRSRR